MPVSRKKRATNNRWDANNMKLVACKIRKELAEKFKAACEANGTTMYAVLTACIKDYISADKSEDEERT